MPYAVFDSKGDRRLLSPGGTTDREDGEAVTRVSIEAEPEPPVSGVSEPELSTPNARVAADRRASRPRFLRT